MKVINNMGVQWRDWEQSESQIPERGFDSHHLHHFEILYNAGWSSLVARQAHNLNVVGSNPAPATIKNLFAAGWCKWQAQRNLTPLVWVRVLSPQPFKNLRNKAIFFSTSVIIPVLKNLANLAPFWASESILRFSKAGI